MKCDPGFCEVGLHGHQVGNRNFHQVPVVLRSEVTLVYPPVRLEPTTIPPGVHPRDAAAEKTETLLACTTVDDINLALP